MDTATNEGQRVHDWRLQRFIDAGYEAEDAETLANLAHVDVSQVEWLIEHGATPELAMMIVL